MKRTKTQEDKTSRDHLLLLLLQRLLLFFLLVVVFGKRASPVLCMGWGVLVSLGTPENSAVQKLSIIIIIILWSEHVSETDEKPGKQD